MPAPHLALILSFLAHHDVDAYATTNNTVKARRTVIDRCGMPADQWDDVTTLDQARQWVKQ